MSYVDRHVVLPMLAALNGGEADVRTIDMTADLAGDYIPSLAALSIIIERDDGLPTTPADLELDPYIVTLDPTRSMVSVGLYAPYTAGGSLYRLTLVVNRTVQGRLYVRNFELRVNPGVATAVPLSTQVGAHIYNEPANSGIITTL